MSADPHGWEPITVAAVASQELPGIDLSADGGDLAVCADRMRAVIAARRRAHAAATDWEAKYFDLLARYESLADRYARRCMDVVAARGAGPAALLARLTIGDDGADVPVVVEG